MDDDQVPFYDRPDRACIDLPFQVFFPVSAMPGAATEARIVCGRCPVREECLQWAMDNPQWGVWGGTTKDERERMARAQGRGYSPPAGGDYAGQAPSAEALRRRQYARTG